MKHIVRKNKPSNVIPINDTVKVVEPEEPRELLTVFKKTRPLTELLVEAKEIQKTCKDYTVPVADLPYGVTADGRSNLCILSENKGFNLTDHAFSQLCGKFGVPVRYMKKCLKEKFYGLAQDNIETFRKYAKGTFLVRTNKDHVRGILSEKYSVMDTPEILESVLEVMPDAKVKGYYMTDERLHVRILGDTLDVPDEDLFWGIQIDSSDVGRSILKVRFMIYKQVCTNGMVAVRGEGDLFIQKHIGITRKEFVASFKEGLDRIPAVAKTVEELIKANIKTKLDTATIQSFTERAVNNLQLDKKYINKIIELVPKYGNNGWGVANALTEIAQDFTLERRLEIEEYASGFLVA